MAGSLEDFIMKLLSKNPEERYQSAYGLLSVLKRCAVSMEETGEVISFEIAHVDEASRFRLPQTFFGREMEERAIRDASEQAKVRRNQSQSVLCIPVLFTGGLTPFALYLENSLIAGVFTQEIRVMLEQMIARMVYVKSLDEARSQSYSPIVPTDDPSSTSAKASQLLFESLTNRETEILYALTDGLTNKEIAYRFGLTEGTVKSYIHHIYGKLGVKRRSQAIPCAKELALIN
ncbi:response regulator transcription factor [Paenibacillus luteus]|uniref:response regulator transcription factor n=1 Tax=Paenibacillus luteus TaxID=2545753 RepID=UPI001144814D|nr:response regulator transcription factor [Paenibacillus luteus]